MVVGLNPAQAQAFNSYFKKSVSSVVDTIYIKIYKDKLINIGSTRWNGNNTSKNKQFSQRVYLQVLKDIWCHIATDVSYFRPYRETKNNRGERKVFMKWIQFRSWFRLSGAKVSTFIIQKFSRCF